MVRMFSKDKLCIDIRGKVLKYLQVGCSKRKGVVTVRKFGEILFDESLCIDGYIADNAETVRIIGNLIKKEKLTARNVYINISGPSVVIRTIEVPYMSVRDLEDYLVMEVSQYLPVDISSNVYDFKVLDSYETEGRKMLNIMLASVPKWLADGYCDMMRKAGLKPKAIDVYPNAIARLFDACNDKSIAVVEINGSNADFIILDSGKLFMYSNILLGSSIATYGRERESLASALHDDESLLSAIEEVINYTRTYLNFYSSRHFGKSIDKVYILGDITMMKDVSQYFSNALQIDVESGISEHIYTISFNELFDVKSGINNEKRVQTYCCNIGLALRDI